MAAERAKEADRLACEAWNKRMLGYKGPAQPSPMLGDALNAGYSYLEVRCLGCDTHQTVALDIVRRPKATTPIYELERYMRCKNCSELQGRPFKLLSAATLWPCGQPRSLPPTPPRFGGRENAEGQRNFSGKPNQARPRVITRCYWIVRNVAASRLISPQSRHTKMRTSFPVLVSRIAWGRRSRETHLPQLTDWSGCRFGEVVSNATIVRSRGDGIALSGSSRISPARQSTA